VPADSGARTALCITSPIAEEKQFVILDLSSTDPRLPTKISSSAGLPVSSRKSLAARPSSFAKNLRIKAQRLSRRIDRRGRRGNSSWISRRCCSLITMMRSVASQASKLLDIHKDPWVLNAPVIAVKNVTMISMDKAANARGPSQQPGRGKPAIKRTPPGGPTVPALASMRVHDVGALTQKKKAVELSRLSAHL